MRIKNLGQVLGMEPMFRKSMTHGVQNVIPCRNGKGRKALVEGPPCLVFLCMFQLDPHQPPKVFMIYYVYVKIFIPVQPFLHQQVLFELTDNKDPTPTPTKKKKKKNTFFSISSK